MHITIKDRTEFKGKIGAVAQRILKTVALTFEFWLYHPCFFTMMPSFSHF